MKKKKILDLKKISIANVNMLTRIRGGNSTICDSNTVPHTDNCESNDCNDETFADNCTVGNTNHTRPQSQHCSAACANSRLDTLNCP